MEEILNKTIQTELKKYKKISLGVICFVVVVLVLLVVANPLGELIDSQKKRNYDRFVQNADGLTNTFREQVEGCSKIETKNDNECFTSVDKEYRIQFGSLIKLFGYESHMQELYQYWQADLQFWYDAKKIKENYSNQDFVEAELEKISEIRQKALQERLSPKFVQSID